MTSTIQTTQYDTYSPTTIIALTTPWPYTPGCETQFELVDLYTTTRISAFDPSLGGAWNTDGLPQWYSQTRCLPKILTSAFENNIQLGSLVCPQSWTRAFASINTNTQTGDIDIEITCCPPSYTLAGTRTLDDLTESACISAVTPGQLITAVPTEAAFAADENITTTNGYTSATYTCQSSDYAVGFMLTATYFSAVTLAEPTYTYPGGGSSYYGDDNWNSYNTYLAIRLGVGITVPVVFLTITIVIFVLLNRRRRRRLQSYQQGFPQTTVPSQYGNIPPQEQDYSQGSGQYYQQEFSAYPPGQNQQSGPPIPMEMQQAPKQEIPGVYGASRDIQVDFPSTTVMNDNQRGQHIRHKPL